MDFDEVRLPERLTFGSRGGPSFNNTVVRLHGGQERRIVRWRAPLHKYNLAPVLKTSTQLDTLIEFYIGRKGPARGFRFKDWMDFTTAADSRSVPTISDVVCQPTDGTFTIFQIAKTYTFGALTFTRKINKPVVGTLVLGKNNVQVLSGFTVNYATGRITFAAAVAPSDVISCGCEFDVPVRFDDAVDILSLTIEAFNKNQTPDISLIEIRVDSTAVLDTTPGNPEVPPPTPGEVGEACERTPINTALPAVFYVTGLPGPGYQFNEGNNWFVLESNLNDLTGLDYTLTAAELVAGVTKGTGVFYNWVDKTTLLNIPGRYYEVMWRWTPRTLADNIDCKVGGIFHIFFSNASIEVPVFGGFSDNNSPWSEIHSSCQRVHNTACLEHGSGQPEISPVVKPPSQGLPGSVLMSQGIDSAKPSGGGAGGTSIVWGDPINLYFSRPKGADTRVMYASAHMLASEEMQQVTQMKGPVIGAVTPTGYGLVNATEYNLEWHVARRKINSTDDMGSVITAGALVASEPKLYRVHMRLIKQLSPFVFDCLRIQLFIKNWMGTGNDFVIFDTGDWTVLTGGGTEIITYGGGSPDTLSYHYAPSGSGNVSVWKSDWTDGI